MPGPRSSPTHFTWSTSVRRPTVCGGRAHEPRVRAASRDRRPGAGRGRLDRHADVPEHVYRHAATRDGLRRRRTPERTFNDSIALAAYEEAGIGPDDVDVAEVYDLSTALELDWSTTSGSPSAARPRRCSAPATDGRRAGPREPVRWPRRFGEAVPAQALAQVFELTWQLRGQADGPSGRGRQRRDDGQPGPVRARILGALAR